MTLNHYSNRRLYFAAIDLCAIGSAFLLSNLKKLSYRISVPDEESLRHVLPPNKYFLGKQLHGATKINLEMMHSQFTVIA